MSVGSCLYLPLVTLVAIKNVEGGGEMYWLMKIFRIDKHRKKSRLLTSPILFLFLLVSRRRILHAQCRKLNKIESADGKISSVDFSFSLLISKMFVSKKNLAF